MKIEISEVKRMLEMVRDESLKPVDDSVLLKDINDKFYNFGVHHMFYAALNKLYDMERIGKAVEQ